MTVTMMSPNQDRFIIDDRHLHAQLRVLLGGRAAETLVLNIKTTGARDDIARATAIAREMVAVHGMTDFGLTHVGEDSSGEMRFQAEQKAKEVLDKAMSDVISLLQENRMVLDGVTQRLLEQEDIDEVVLGQVVDQAGGMTVPPELGGALGGGLGGGNSMI